MQINHRTAKMTAAELDAEIGEVFAYGADGPRFCSRHYVGMAYCFRAAGHDGEHVTVANSGRMIEWDEAPAPAAEPEFCEHGLSAWLCAGPNHYPADDGLPF